MRSTDKVGQSPTTRRRSAHDSRGTIAADTLYDDGARTQSRVEFFFFFLPTRAKPDGTGFYERLNIISIVVYPP